VGVHPERPECVVKIEDDQSRQGKSIVKCFRGVGSFGHIAGNGRLGRLLGHVEKERRKHSEENEGRKHRGWKP